MSHDEMSADDTRSSKRKERRAAYGKRKPAPRRVFTASDYIREDWTPQDVIEMLERRACGYNGILRQVLCTAADHLRNYQRAMTEHDAKIDDLIQEARISEELADLADDEARNRVDMPRDGS